MTTNTKRALSGLAAGILFLLPLAACGEDEDNDGGTTDEEIQDVEDTAEDIEQDIEEEVDSQDRGSNEDGE